MDEGELAILDATAHALKFAGFQDMYFQNSFGPEYEITPDAKLSNVPRLVISQQEEGPNARRWFYGAGSAERG
jgi:threonine synthase